MAIELKIPTVGESINEVQIGEWLKSEGDSVQADEAVAVIESEKTNFELPAPQSGRLSKILRQAGETVKVGDAIGLLDSENELGQQASAQPKQETARKPGSAPTPPADQPVAQASKPAVSQVSKPARPQPGQGPADSEADKPVRAEARPTAPAGRTGAKTPEPKKVPEAAEPLNGQAGAELDAADTARSEDSAPSPSEAPPAQKQPAPSPPTPPVETLPKPSPPDRTGTDGREEERVPMTMWRRTIVRRLLEAKQTMAMLSTFGEADLTAVQNLRRDHGAAFEKRYEVKLGLMSFFVKAAIDALKQFPQLNAEIRENDVLFRNYFDIGVAIATERGLVVPVLRAAERLSFAELERAIGDFARRARETSLRPAELEGGTFTITNGGVFGSLLSTPIINPPQTGILGLHAIQERPVAVNGQVVIRPMMYLALTYDHRLVDGREAVLFLRRIKEGIETPSRLLIEV